MISIRHLTLKRYLLSGLRRYFLMIMMNILPFSFLRIFSLRLAGVRIGRGCYVGFNVIPDTNYPELIRIGDYVTISHNCTFLTHAQSPVKSRLSKVYNECAEINIHDGAWIALGVLVLPGVLVHEDCFIAAGSVVAKSTHARGWLYAGCPATQKRRLL